MLNLSVGGGGGGGGGLPRLSQGTRLGCAMCKLIFPVRGGGGGGRSPRGERGWEGGAILCIECKRGRLGEFFWVAVG